MPMWNDWQAQGSQVAGGLSSLGRDARRLNPVACAFPEQPDRPLLFTPSRAAQLRLAPDVLGRAAAGGYVEEHLKYTGGPINNDEWNKLRKRHSLEVVATEQSAASSPSRQHEQEDPR